MNDAWRISHPDKQKKIEIGFQHFDTVWLLDPHKIKKSIPGRIKTQM
jgi:hypothetical protein